MDHMFNQAIEMDMVIPPKTRTHADGTRYKLGFGPGQWNHKSIEGLALSHLLNIRDFITTGRADTLVIDKATKIAEIDEAIKQRREAGAYVRKTEFQVEPELVEFVARQRGLRIPKSGCAVIFVDPEGKRHRVADGRLLVCFDQTIKVKPKTETKARRRKKAQ
jgi:hypothetical protein